MPRITRIRLLTIVATVVAVTLLPGVLKAVYVTPHAVFISHGSRAGQVTVGNSGETPEEVTVELRFGFPDTDSAGTPFIRFVDDPGPEFPSAVEWIRPYPRRLRLEPGEQQVVRLLATPPDDLPDGEYWTRMIVSGQGASVPIESSDTAVRAGVSLVMRIITAVTYRKGEVRTGITLRGLEAAVEGDSIVAWVDATREGNGAYLGTVNFEVLGQDHEPIREWIIPVAVYYPMVRRFALPLDSLASGTHVLRLTIRADRPDLRTDDVLSAPTVSDSIEILVP
jgi:hypothetical protein